MRLKRLFVLLCLVCAAAILFGCDTVVEEPGNDEKENAENEQNYEVFTVGSAHFDVKIDRTMSATYTLVGGGGGGAATPTYWLKTDVVCDTSLFQVEGVAHLYGVNGELLEISTLKRENVSAEANKSFRLKFRVSDDIVKKVSDADVVLKGYSHEKPKILIDLMVDGVLYKRAKASAGGAVSLDTPQKEGFIFDNWYTDSTFTKSYNPLTPLTDDITLYAKFKFDEAAAKARIYENEAKAIVKVTTYLYDTNVFGSVTQSIKVTDFGVIIGKTPNGYYCVLVDSSTAYKGGWEHQEITVTDYTGTEYEVFIDTADFDAKYGLAAIYFKATKTLGEIKFAGSDATTGEGVIFVGDEYISFGEVLGYEKHKRPVVSYEESNVSFDAMVHNAYDGGRFDGNVIFNYNFELVGLNYDVDFPHQDKNIDGYAIPYSKIMEYLKKYIY